MWKEIHIGVKSKSKTYLSCYQDFKLQCTHFEFLSLIKLLCKLLYLEILAISAMNNATQLYIKRVLVENNN